MSRPNLTLLGPHNRRMVQWACSACGDLHLDDEPAAWSRRHPYPLYTQCPVTRTHVLARVHPLHPERVS